jgi:hypothetical protein
MTTVVDMRLSTPRRTRMAKRIGDVKIPMTASPQRATRTRSPSGNAGLYGCACAIRVVTSTGGMTADFLVPDEARKFAAARERVNRRYRLKSRH